MKREDPKTWLDWQLKHGSHDFPGPDGGTCINEAAVVVAGFAYREVMSIRDLPESFCPVISQFALSLNDAMPEGEVLNRLLPYALRLSGSSGGREHANDRASMLAFNSATVFAPIALVGFDAETASRLGNASTRDAALGLLIKLEDRALPANTRESVGAARRAVDRSLNGKDAIYTAELAAVSAIRAASIDDHAWDKALETIDMLLSVGKQADPIETALIEERAANVLALH